MSTNKHFFLNEGKPEIFSLFSIQIYNILWQIVITSFKINYFKLKWRKLNIKILFRVHLLTLFYRIWSCISVLPKNIRIPGIYHSSEKKGTTDDTKLLCKGLLKDLKYK